MLSALHCCCTQLLLCCILKPRCMDRTAAVAELLLLTALTICLPSRAAFSASSAAERSFSHCCTLISRFTGSGTLADSCCSSSCKDLQTEQWHTSLESCNILQTRQGAHKDKPKCTLL